MVLAMLKDALTFCHNQVDQLGVLVRVGRVLAVAQNTKWAALRLDFKGVSRIHMATLLRRYFVQARVDEKVIKSV